MNRLYPILSTLIALAGCLLLPAALLACPSCKDGLEQGQSGQIQAYFWSILFMMSMPFAIFGGLSAYFYYEVRKARAQRAAAPASAAVDALTAARAGSV